MYVFDVMRKQASKLRCRKALGDMGCSTPLHFVATCPNSATVCCTTTPTWADGFLGSCRQGHPPCKTSGMGRQQQEQLASVQREAAERLQRCEGSLATLGAGMREPGRGLSGGDLSR